MSDNPRTTKVLVDESSINGEADHYTIRILDRAGRTLNINIDGEDPVLVYQARHPHILPYRGQSASVSKPAEDRIVQTAEEEKEDPYEHLYVKYVHTSQTKTYDRVKAQALDNEGIPVDHDNILGMTRKPFVYKSFYALVFPFMNHGSLRTIMHRKFQFGLPEDLILLVLRDVLRGLLVIHQAKDIHNEIHAGHIFFRDKPSAQIKLGYSASVFDLDADQEFHHRNSICDWASAPEVHKEAVSERIRRYSVKSDVWQVGILAIELAYGGIIVDDRAAFNEIVKKITGSKCLPKKPNGYLLGRSKENSLKGVIKGAAKSLKGIIKGAALVLSGKAPQRDFSPDFSKLVAKCLAKKPADRPTVAELLERDIFSGLKRSVLQFSNEVN